MKLRRILSALTAASVLSAVIPTVSAEDLDAASYSYEVMPILEGMNEYYFIKTDNPDPKTFTFVDKDTKYYDGDYSLSRCTYEFADVKYENTETLRVDGGYLFDGYKSDGGTLTLKINNNPNSYYSSWTETDITCEVPVAVDYIDYLIDTYATKDDFFENMSAVQSGLNRISRYSGSSIRGNLTKDPDEYWGVTARTHLDQYFYIFSPYSRTDSKRLFASYVYPYCCDSWGFPGILSSAAKRIEPTAEVAWDSYNHYRINITYNGTTKSYGGSGNGEGTEISEDKIIKYFHFGSSTDTVNLADARQLLVDYAKIEMEDDIPTEGKLTWKQINDTVESGSWAKVIGGYPYFYKADDRDSYSAKEWGVGYSIYWGGSLGFASNSWVDGRYVNLNEVYEPGAKFEDHTDANVIMYNLLLPQISYDRSYKYNYETSSYEYFYSNVSVTYSFKTTKLYYDSTYDCWIPSSLNMSLCDKLIEQGLLDKKALEICCFTADELKAMGVDRNTDITPECGYIYDQTVEPGTPFGAFDGVTSEVRNGFLLINMKGGTQVIKLSAVTPEAVDAMIGDKVTLAHYVNAIGSDTASDCIVLTDAQMKAVEAVLAADLG